MADKPRGRRGRPKVAEPIDTPVTLKVTAAQRLELRRVAVENGTHVSTVIREAVDEFVSDYRERTVFGRPKR